MEPRRRGGIRGAWHRFKNLFRRKKLEAEMGVAGGGAPTGGGAYETRSGVMPRRGIMRKIADFFTGRRRTAVM